MSEEQRAVLETLLEEKIQERDDVNEEWADGYLSFDEAVERSQMLSAEILDIVTTLHP